MVGTAAGALYFESFLPACLWQFAGDFPRVSRFTAFDVAARRATTLAWLIGAMLFVVNVVDAYHVIEADAIKVLVRSDPNNAFWHAITLMLFPAVVTIFVRARQAPAQERQMVAGLAAVITVGTGPLLLLGAGLMLSPRLQHWLSQSTPVERVWLDTFIIGGLTATPFLSAIVVVVDRPFELRRFVLRAFHYALARHALSGLFFAPLALAANRLYRRRHDRIHDALAGVDAVVLSSYAVVFIMAVAMRPYLLRLLDRLESRRNTEHAGQLSQALERVRLARGSREIAAVIAEEARDGTGAQFAHVFVPDGSGQLTDCAGAATPMPAGGALAAVLRECAGSLDTSANGAVPALLPLAERAWIERQQFDVLTPVHNRDDSVAAVIALGPKLGHVPFDQHDSWLLTAIAAAAATGWQWNSAPLARHHDAGADDDSCNSEVAFECETCGTVAASRVLSCDCGSQARLAGLPRRIGEHLLVTRRLGAGGMGIVYLARDTILNRDVAVKTLPALKAGAATRLREEARAMAALNHEALATIYGLQTWRHTPILVVEYFPRGTLADQLGRGPLTADAIRQLGVAIAGGLAYMHTAGMLHRDLKPSNIGMTTAGAPKLLDFGLATLWSGATEARAARLIGTPAYLPPETNTAQGATPLWDLWALAIVMLEAATGISPRHGRDRGSSLRRVDAPWYAATLPADVTVPHQLHAFFARALAPRPDQRFQSAGELRVALERLTTS